MGRKALSGVLIVVGLSLVALSVSADAVGLGNYSFGWEQKLGVALGVSLVWFAGLRLLGWAPRRQGGSAPDPQHTTPAPA